MDILFIKDILLIIAGMVLLIKGADMLVDGAASLARRFNVSELAIGLTIVAFGTSAPEMVVSLSANIGAFAHPEIALGNVIGSNNLNLFIVLGITGLIAPIAVQKNTVRIEIPISLAAAIILFLLANFAFPGGAGNMLTRADGIILLVLFAAFIFYVYKSMKTDISEDDTSSTKTFSLIKSIMFVVIGLVILVSGGRLVVDSAVKIAETLGISEKVIGLTIVALGTSLPELVTSVTAVIKKKSDIAVGNIIGSNVFNIFLITGICAVVNPMRYSPAFNKDIYLIIIGTVLLFLAMFTGKKRILDRWEAAILVSVYAGYVVYLIYAERGVGVVV